MLPAIGSMISPAIWSPTSANSLLRRVQIVVRHRQRQIGKRLRHAGRCRHAERQRAGTRLDQERIAVAVIAAFELHDLVAPGVAARERESPTSSLRCRS